MPHVAALVVLLGCLNGTLIEQDEMIRRLHLAEKAIDQGDWKKARAILVLRSDEILEDARLDKRRALLLATVNLRVGRTQAAARAFRRFLRHRKDDPVLRARLAEAEADHGGDQEVEARLILSDLERRDLVPDAEAWAALARVRHRDSDFVGRDRALARCFATARDPSATCLKLSLASR
jgi:predicted Zn-dependent protease